MVSIGHATLGDTGVTVLYAGPQGAVASVDVRGGGPGTRETDLLEPHNTVERVHAIVLSGGSAFGLAAADGAMRELATHDIGFPVFGEDRPGPRVPIIPAAVIFDLIVGEVHYPTASDGAAALRAALSDAAFAPLLEVSGTVGAGTGATAGRLRGGFGSASVTAHAPSHNYQVTAYMVANPAGEVVDAETGELFGARAYERATGESLEALDPEAYAAVPDPKQSKLNTTIGVVVTDAPVTKAQAKRLALTAHDGIARAVRPAHSPLDGDTIFALSDISADATAAAPIAAAPAAAAGVDTPTMMALGVAAADAVEAAIVDAVVHAAPGFGLATYATLPKRA
ncbi:P1 family peptidase [Corynebacterium phoceense]|uniref:P1 family peptidase n=2 Tax=Corynebacterium phoceense TaxID=1686286 RepID=UPI00211CA848|nr:P1 family peptidase [Corynebacterium phoceense]MCQ9341826.1 P1 family peptidase [Corynebacterium phoceense]